ncbi:MAG: DJ-1/PfpI family protein [Synergistaceae bacterium]|nr:DJ-1/PfpI family protein [Synergistaceae bacterium]
MKNVGIYLFNKVELLDFAGPYEVFSSTSELSDHKDFKVFTISEDGGAIKSVNGLIVIPDYSFDNHPKIDILILPGGEGTKNEIKKKKVMEWVNKTQESAEILATVCSGARIPAVLGLLDGLQATTHRSVIDDVKKLAPKVTIDHTKRFIDNGKIMTSGGISAGIDLSLHIVKKLCGEETANKTMTYMEYGDAAPKNH